MADKKGESVRITTPIGRMNFSSLFEPRENNLSKKMEYRCDILFDKSAMATPEYKAMKEAALKCAASKWGDDQTKWPKPFQTPFKRQEDCTRKDQEGNEFMRDGYEEGCTYISLKSQDPPQVVSSQRDAGKKLIPITDTSQLWDGCYIRASITFWPYSQAGNNGVTAYLNNVQKIKDGDALGGRLTPEEDFAPLEGAAEESESSGGGLI